MKPRPHEYHVVLTSDEIVTLQCALDIYAEVSKSPTNAAKAETLLKMIETDDQRCKVVYTDGKP